VLNFQITMTLALSTILFLVMLILIFLAFLCDK